MSKRMEKAERKLWSLIEKIPWFWLGFTAVLVLALPYFVLGSRCYVQITDQLDGEVLNYIYRAKYLFSGEDVIPEFMGGMGKNAMTLPAPGGVLFYRLLPPFAAFAAMHIFMAAAGNGGMYLLARRLTGSSLIACLAAGIFVCLPLYPVYGLSVSGQPLLLWAVIRCCEAGGSAGKKWKYYLCILLYAVTSSLALAGFACLGVLAFAWLWCLLTRRRRICRELGIVILLLSGGFLVCNVGLLAGFLGLGESCAPHREEMVLAAMPDWQGYFREIFLEGGAYVKSYNGVIVLLTAAVLVLDPLMFWGKAGGFGQGREDAVGAREQREAEAKESGGTRGLSGRGAYRAVAAASALVFVLSALAVIWRTQWMTELRMSLGGPAKTFQADRVCWLLPLCWYTLLALDLYILLRRWRGWLLLRWGAAVAAVGALCFTVYENSTIYHNLRLMIFPETYHLMNWEDYYAEDVYGQIDDFLQRDKASYRVASLGVNPAAALYNGFYTLDGYSNFYSLDYKHEFREIIHRELAKNQETRVYFDAWGNRCYLLNSETGNYMTVGKNAGSSYQNLELDTGKMYEMGARYLFAAMPVDNWRELGLIPVREEPFETPESYYAIWVYEISGQKTGRQRTVLLTFQNVVK